MPINTIYIIHNTANYKKYVGQTWTSLKERWSRGYHNSTYLYHAIQKHGGEAFYYETLALCSDQETADYLERYYIELFETLDHEKGYNIRGGGENKFQHSPETIKRMSASATQSKVNAEQVIAIRKAFDEGTTILYLAEKYGVDDSTISSIIYRRTWRHIPGNMPPKNRKTKLTESNIVEIRSLFTTGQMSAIELGKKFGISRNQIYKIASGELFKKMPGAVPTQLQTRKSPHIHNKKLSDGDVISITQLREAGWYYQQLADKFGVSISGIRHALGKIPKP